MSKPKPINEFLASNTKVELIGIHKETGQVYKKIIELKEYKTIERNSKFNYLPPYQLGFSQYKDVIEI